MEMATPRLFIQSSEISRRYTAGGRGHKRGPLTQKMNEIAKHVTVRPYRVNLGKETGCHFVQGQKITTRNFNTRHKQKAPYAGGERA